MLRISIHEAQDIVTLRLEGRLIGAWVGEVERCWRRAITGLDERRVVIDLTAVSFVDPAGAALVSKMQEEGFRLIGAGPCGPRRS
jgi:anti-anti-sigma regulatory factor